MNLAAPPPTRREGSRHARVAPRRARPRRPRRPGPRLLLERPRRRVRLRRRPQESATTRSSGTSPPSSPEATRGWRTGTRLPHLRPQPPVGGVAPAGYHLVNVLVHVANALLVYALVRLTFRTPRLRGSALAPSSRAIAFAAAALFVAHPLHSQAVAYVVQRLTALATTFYLATVVLYAAWRLRDGPDRPRWRRPSSGPRCSRPRSSPRGPRRSRSPSPSRSSCTSCRSSRGPSGPPALARTGPRHAAGHPAHDARRAGRGRVGAGRAPRGEHPRRHAAAAARVPHDPARRRRRVPAALAFPAGQSVDHDVPVYRSLLEPRVAASAAVLALLALLAALLYRRTSRPGRAGRARPGGPPRGVRDRLVLPRAPRRVVRHPNLGPHVRAPGLPPLGRAPRRRGDRLATLARRLGDRPGADHGPRGRARRRRALRRDPRPQRGLGGRPVPVVRRGAQGAAQAEAVPEPRDRPRALRPEGARRPRAAAGGDPRPGVHLRPGAARGSAPVRRPARRAEPELREVLRLEPRDPEALFNLAMLLWTSARREEARGRFGRFLAVASSGYPKARRIAAPASAGWPLTRHLALG